MTMSGTTKKTSVPGLDCTQRAPGREDGKRGDVEWRRRGQSRTETGPRGGSQEERGAVTLDGVRTAARSACVGRIECYHLNSSFVCGELSGVHGISHLAGFKCGRGIPTVHILTAFGFLACLSSSFLLGSDQNTVLQTLLSCAQGTSLVLPKYLSTSRDNAATSAASYLKRNENITKVGRTN